MRKGFEGLNVLATVGVAFGWSPAINAVACAGNAAVSLYKLNSFDSSGKPVDWMIKSTRSVEVWMPTTASR
jgi:hypothetical protein